LTKEVKNFSFTFLDNGMLFSKTNNHSFDCDQNKQRVLRPTPFIYCKLEQRCPKKSEHVNNLSRDY